MSFLAKLELGSAEYNVLNVDYEISQPIDHQNKPSGKPKGGIINLTIESNQKNDIVEWMVSPTMKKSGKITFFKRDANSSMRTLAFNDGFCVNYKEIFDASGDNPMKLNIKVSAGEMKINNANSLVHPWSTAGAMAAEAAKDMGAFSIASFMDNDMMQSAEKNLNDAKSEISSAKDEAEKDIADAKKKAEDAKSEAEKEVNDAKKEVTQEVDAAKKEATDAKNEATKEYDDAKKEATQEVDAAKKEAIDAKNEVMQDADAAKKEAMDAKNEATKEAEDAKKEVTGAASDAEKSAKSSEQEASKSIADAGKGIPSFMP